MEAFADVALPSALELEDTEVEMQVYGDDGCWHRLAIGEASTACGDLVSRGAGRRYPAYDGKLCAAGCFAPFELRLAEQLALGSQPMPTIKP